MKKCAEYVIQASICDDESPLNVSESTDSDGEEAEDSQAKYKSHIVFPSSNPLVP